MRHRRARSQSWVNGGLETHREPTTGWLITWAARRARRRYHRRVMDLRRRAFDYTAVGPRSVRGSTPIAALSSRARTCWLRRSP